MKYNSIGEQLIAKAQELDPSYKPDKFNDMSEAINIILNNNGYVDEEDVLNIIENNSEQVSELSIGTSVSFNGKDDEQIPTSKAVRQKIDNKASNYYNKAEVEAMIDQKINVSINGILSEEY